jgi:hypothetical protein
VLPIHREANKNAMGCGKKKHKMLSLESQKEALTNVDWEEGETSFQKRYKLFPLNLKYL